MILLNLYYTQCATWTISIIRNLRDSEIWLLVVQKVHHPKIIEDFIKKFFSPLSLLFGGKIDIPIIYRSGNLTIFLIKSIPFLSVIAMCLILVVSGQEDHVFPKRGTSVDNNSGCYYTVEFNNPCADVMNEVKARLNG